jgi:iron complex outermembrane receptor protein
MLYSKQLLRIVFVLFSLFFGFIGFTYSQETKIQGTIVTSDDARPLPGVLVFLTPGDHSATTGANGDFEFSSLEPGNYQLKASVPSFKDLRQSVTVEAGKVIRLDLKMTLSALSENVVVTASPEAQSTLRTYQPTSVLGSTELQQNLSGTLGETLKNEPGVNMRNFGPGAARPVIRGFDGDRVLILQDGERTADLSSQSGDHGVPIDPATIEKIEVIRGPASLLYGSNAIGGVVNAISDEVGHDSPFEGVVGHIVAEYGSVNTEGAGNGHVDVGTGNFIFHAGGGIRDAGNYDSAEGEVLNSQTKTETGKFGGDYVTDSGSHFGATYNIDNLKYGIPLDPEEADEVRVLHIRRHHIDFHGGTPESDSLFSHLRFNLGFTDYKHDEIANGEIGTTFNNEVFEFRGLADHGKYGRLSGSIGVSGLHRDYETVGEEVLAPHTKQNNISVFNYEQLGYDWGSFQFGARLDHTSYTPEGLTDRTFTGVSGSTGIIYNVGSNSTLSANYGLAYRAPAIEELYNNGPHDGTLSFEIGDPNLNRELGHNVDFSVRRQTDRLNAEFTVFYAKIQDFIFFAPNGEIDEEEGLPIVLYQQGDSHFTGYEAVLLAGVNNWLWIKGGSDYVTAKLDDGRYLPRIPALRGRVGVEIRHKGFTISPEFVAVAKQDRVFDLETPTDGYNLFNIVASYTHTTGRINHTFTAALKNATDEFYQNHINVLKDIAPEPGRSFKVTYALEFF